MLAPCSRPLLVEAETPPLTTPLGGCDNQGEGGVLVAVLVTEGVAVLADPVSRSRRMTK